MITSTPSRAGLGSFLISAKRRPNKRKKFTDRPEEMIDGKGQNTFPRSRECNVCNTLEILNLLN